MLFSQSAYGQTITAPAANGLAIDTFQFAIRANPAFTFQTKVFAWDPVNSRITGSELYTSANIQAPGDNLFHTYSFSSVNAPVVSGGTYVIFIWAAQGAVPFGNAQQGYVSSSDLYPGGAFVFQNNNGNFATLSTSSWTTGFVGARDVAFSITYAAQAGTE